jgi:hypothetical protein
MVTRGDNGVGRFSVNIEVDDAICEPKRGTALISAIVLEDLDVLVDCVAERVVPHNPTGATYEIE